MNRSCENVVVWFLSKSQYIVLNEGGGKVRWTGVSVEAETRSNWAWHPGLKRYADQGCLSKLKRGVTGLATRAPKSTVNGGVCRGWNAEYLDSALGLSTRAPKSTVNGGVCRGWDAEYLGSALGLQKVRWTGVSVEAETPSNWAWHRAPNEQWLFEGFFRDFFYKLKRSQLMRFAPQVQFSGKRIKVNSIPNQNLTKTETWQKKTTVIGLLALQ